MSTLTSCNAKISEIIYILKEESKMLKQGSFGELARILEHKNDKLAEFDVLVSNLNSKDNIEHIAPQIERLKRMATENGILLKAAFHGVKSAQERLKKMRTQDAQIGAYNKAGASIVLNENNNLSEKHV